jgi:MazG family protein
VLLFGLYKAEAQFGDGIIETTLLFSAEVAFGFFLQHGKEVDVVAAEVEIRLALFGEGQQAHVEFGLEAEGVDQEIEIGCGEFGGEFVVVLGVRAQVGVYFVHDISLQCAAWQLGRTRLSSRVPRNPECYIWTIAPFMVEDSGSAGQKLERLIEIMARLRAPDGCPWDREQSFDTIKKFTVEETYEVLDAIDRRDWAGLREELGDYLLQAVFYAQMASEEKLFSIGDCLDAINEKLVRRHPHIFGDETARTGDEVLKLWEAVKTEEKRGKGDAAKGMLEAIPRAQPALIEAQQISSKAARAGFDWANAGDVIAKLEEEIAEFRVAQAAGSKDQMEDELGDLLFTIVNLARFAKVDPEQALRRTNAKFRQRFGHVERRLAEEGGEVTGTAIDRLEALWQEAKK